MKMFTMVCGAMLLAAGTGRGAEVQVCVEYDSQPRVVTTAEKTAGALLNAAEVTLRWKTGLKGCAENGVRVTLTESSKAAGHPGAYGYAMPYEKSHIVIFVDRVRAAEPGDGMARLLGHVLAHEITHILQAIVRHSETGLMSAHWTPSDHVRMRGQLLAWDPADSSLIWAGLAGR